MGDFWSRLLGKKKTETRSDNPIVAQLSAEHEEDIKLNRAELRKVDQITKTMVKNQPKPGINYETMDYWCETMLVLMRVAPGNEKVKRKAYSETMDALRNNVGRFLTARDDLPGGNGLIPEDILNFYWGSEKFKELWAAIGQNEMTLRDFIINRAVELGVIT